MNRLFSIDYFNVKSESEKTIDIFKKIMKKAIYNLLPRLINYSKHLDKVETFVEKSWLYLDANGKNHEYMFMRDLRLIMSVNGTVVIGKWDLLPNGKLLIDRVSDKIMLENQFIDDALMILKKSASEEEPFILVDEKKIPDLDVLKYLYKFEERQIPKPPLEPNTVEIQPSGSIRFNEIEIGFRVKHHAGLIVSGTFDLNLPNIRRFMVVENGVITDLYYLVSYLDEKNREIKIRQESKYLTSGSKIEYLHLLDISFNKEIKLRLFDDTKVRYNTKIDSSGNVIIVTDKDALFLLFGLIVLLLIGYLWIQGTN